MRRSGRDPPAFIEQGTSTTGNSSQATASRSAPMPQQRFSNLITPPRRPTATVILPSACSFECDQRRVRFPEGHTITLRYDGNAPVSSRPSSQQGSHPPSTRSNLALDFVLDLEEGHFSDTTAEDEVSNSDHGSESQEDAPSSLQTDITNMTQQKLDSVPEHHHRRRPTSLPVPNRRHPSQEQIVHQTHISHAKRSNFMPSRLPYAPRHNEPSDDDLVDAQIQQLGLSDTLKEDEEFHNGRVASPSNSPESSASDEPIFTMDGIYEYTERPKATDRSEEPERFGRLENPGRPLRTSRSIMPERHQPSLQSIPERDAFMPGHRHSASLTSSGFSACTSSNSAASRRPTRPNHDLSPNHGQGNSAQSAPRRSNLTSSLAGLSRISGMAHTVISRPTQTTEVAPVASTSGRKPTNRQRHSAPPAPRTSHGPCLSTGTNEPRHATRTSLSVSTAGRSRNLVFLPTSHSSQQAFSPEAVIYQYSTSSNRILHHHSQAMFEHQPYTPPSSSSTRSSPRVFDTAPPAYTPRRVQVPEESFEERFSQSAHRTREPSSTVEYPANPDTPATSPAIAPRRRPLSDQLSSQMSMMRTRPNARNRSGLSWDTLAASRFPPQIPWQNPAPQMAASSRYPPQQQPAMPTVPSRMAAKRMTAPPRPTRPALDPTLTPFTPNRETNSRPQSQPSGHLAPSQSPASCQWLVKPNTAASFSPSSSSSTPYERLPELILAAFPQIPLTVPPLQPCRMSSGSVLVPTNRNGSARASLPESPTLGAALGSRSAAMQIVTENQLQVRAVGASSNAGQAGQAGQASKHPNRPPLKTPLKNPFRNLFNGNFLKKKDKGTDKGKGRKE